MIRGIEDLSPRLQKAMLGCICNYFDLSKDIEVEEIEENVYQILDTKFYVISDDDIQRKITSYNSNLFENFFDGLTSEQKKFINRDLWEEEYGVSTFEEWLSKDTEWLVDDADYYGGYNFYEVH
jgi:uncharacterized protein with ATP-grasp and redox domains